MRYRVDLPLRAHPPIKHKACLGTPCVIAIAWMPFANSERNAPAINASDICAVIVSHAQRPIAIQLLARQIHQVGSQDVVGGAATSVVQDIHAVIRCDQIDFQIANVGMEDIHRDKRIARSGTRTTRNRDRAVDGGVVGDGDIGSVAVGLNNARTYVDGLSPGVGQSAIVSHGQCNGVRARSGIRMTRIDSRRCGTISEVPRPRYNRSIGIGRCIDECCRRA